MIWNNVSDSGKSNAPQVENALLYRGIENQGSPACSTCICPAYILSILRIMKFCVKDISTIVQGRIVIFGMQVDDALMYHGIES